MARITRVRSRTYSLSGSTTIYPSTNWSGTGSTTTATVSNFSSISDSRGSPVVPSPMFSTQRSGAVIWTGKTKNSASSRIFNKWPIINGTGAATETDITPLAPPNGWYLDAIARSNPSRPVVTPPELLQDLIEIPRQLRDVWKALRHPKSVFTPKGLANNYLGIKFGWLPLIKDVEDLLDLQDLVTKRSQELAQLYSGRGLRRRLKFGSDKKVFSFYSDVAMSGTNTYIRFYHDQVITKDSWATIRWKPTTPPPYHPQDARMTNQIRRIVLGLTPEGMFKGLWNVIPWTWLIGWFTNVGRYTLLYSNTVPAEFSKACFMSQSVMTVLPTYAKPTNAEIFTMKGDGGHIRTVKTRIVSGQVLPGINMPFLGISQLSVLAALGVQRMRSIP